MSLAVFLGLSEIRVHEGQTKIFQCKSNHIIVKLSRLFLIHSFSAWLDRVVPCVLQDVNLLLENLQ